MNILLNILMLVSDYIVVILVAIIPFFVFAEPFISNFHFFIFTFGTIPLCGINMFLHRKYRPEKKWSMALRVLSTIGRILTFLGVLLALVFIYEFIKISFE